LTVRVLVVLMLVVATAHAQPSAPTTPAVPAAPTTPAVPAAPTPAPGPSAPAQGPPPPPDAPPTTPAMVAFEEGRALLDAGDYTAACAKFTVSITADPDAPGTLLNLGLCNEKLGKTATALGWYRRAQFRSAEAKMNEYETAAKEHAVVLAAKVPTLHIETAPDAIVKLDDRQLDGVERARVELDPGTHVIEVRTRGAPAHESERRTITIKDGEKQSLDVRPPVPTRYFVIDRGVTQRRYAYLAFGGGAALYVASATLSLVGKSKYDATDHPDTYQHWRNVVRFGGSSLFIAGSAAIAAGVYLYVKAPRAERVIAPTIEPDQLGVAYAGSF
jgi:hypothetical protein